MSTSCLNHFEIWVVSPLPLIKIVAYWTITKGRGGALGEHAPQPSKTCFFANFSCFPSTMNGYGPGLGVNVLCAYLGNIFQLCRIIVKRVLIFIS